VHIQEKKVNIVEKSTLQTDTVSASSKTKNIIRKKRSLLIPTQNYSKKFDRRKNHGSGQHTARKKKWNSFFSEGFAFARKPYRPTSNLAHWKSAHARTMRERALLSKRAPSVVVPLHM